MRGGPKIKKKQGTSLTPFL